MLKNVYFNFEFSAATTQVLDVTFWKQWYTLFKSIKIQEGHIKFIKNNSKEMQFFWTYHSSRNTEKRIKVSKETFFNIDFIHTYIYIYISHQY